MVHVLKVQLEDSNGEKQIRRLAVSSDVASNFKLLKEKIQNLFQLKNNFSMKWKDSDEDFILMSSDEELAQALANAEDGLLRVYLYRMEGVHTEPKTTEAPTGSGIEHRLVTCDGCEKDIFGARYKCLQCENYDLCSACNTANKHPDHDMIKLVKPSDVPREWVFWGSRKLWRSLFGVCPGHFFRRHQGKGESSPTAEPTEGSTKTSPKNSRRQCHGSNFHGFPGEALFNALGQEFGDAQKLFTEAVESFANVLPGGIEVIVGKEPFSAECKVKTTVHRTDAKQPGSAEASTNTKEEEQATKPENKADVQAPPKKEEPEPVSAQPKKEETPEVLVQPQHEENISVPKSDVEEPKVPVSETTKSAECREQSPTANLDTSTGADDWTFIQEDESTTAACAAEPSAQVPTETPKDVLYPKLEEISRKLEDGNVVQSNDPKIINALIKMQAMGFTNEGGWLERLLITKHGNINEALDALYPFSQRH